MMNLGNAPVFDDDILKFGSIMNVLVLPDICKASQSKDKSCDL